MSNAFLVSIEESACLISVYQSSPEQARGGIAPRTDGTCTWILRDSMYNDWLILNTSRLLWVSGNSGCGKSVLSTFIVDHIKESMPASTVCCFFCDDKVDLQSTAVSLQRSMLHQLLSTKVSLLNHLLPDFEVKGGAMFIEEILLWKALLACLEDPNSGSVICIIDALDECERRGRTQFLNSLTKHFNREVVLSGQSSVEFLLTSRPEVQIVDVLAIPTIRLKIEDQLDNVSADIKLVAQEKISELASLRQFPQRTQDWLLQKLISDADRTFLWVSLVLDMLKKSAQASREAFKELLSSLTSGLEDTYLKMLERIPKGDRP
ncbi:hypothetical protein MMC18_003965 [Xylographa bjoerkii]|nr:hypothetical protein [Xylographa bjoerkii]